MNRYRYILEPYKGMNSRYYCPQCKKKEFVRYIDTRTGKYIADNVGKCNRENNCGYHYTPKQYFQDHSSFAKSDSKPQIVLPQQRQKPVSLIPVEIFKASLSISGLATNHFVKFLVDRFGIDVTNKLIEKYFVGTSKHWSGATVFWQIDINGRIRAGKIMLYDSQTGKRVKEPFSHITWVHTALKLNGFNLKQCFFGEHLLRESNNPVAIVESEKTAIICSVYFPQLIWLAAGSLNNINTEKCHVLRGRKVKLFPDCKGFDKWNQKAKEFNFDISDLLERRASPQEREQGFDLADYLLRFDHREFTEPPAPIQPKRTILEKKSTTQNWDQEISELEQFFNDIPPIDSIVNLNQYTKIIDVKKFINSHLTIVKAQNGNPCYRPYLESLQ